MDRIERLAMVMQGVLPRLSLVECSEAIEALRHYLRTHPEDGPWSIMYATEAYREFAEKRVGSRVMGFNHGMPTLVIKDPMPVTETEEDWMSLDGLEVIEYTYAADGIYTPNGVAVAAEDDPFVAVPKPNGHANGHANGHSKGVAHPEWLSIRFDVMRVSRHNLRLSQRQLGDAMGVPQTVVSQLERGVTNLDPLILPRLAKALNVEPDVLIWKPSDGPVEVAPLETLSPNKGKGTRKRAPLGKRSERVTLRPRAVEEARRELNLTQTELARQAGISTGTIWLIERKGQTVNPDQLARIADTLCVMPEELLPGPAEHAEDPEPEQAIYLEADPEPFNLDLIPATELQPRKRRFLNWINP